jgi:hypothetical protein
LLVSSDGCGFFFLLYNSLLYSAVHVHAAFGDGGHKWQPLNVPVATSYWRDASRRGNLAGSNSDNDRQLRPGDDGAHPSVMETDGGSGSIAVLVSVWCWIFQFCNF